MRWTELTSDPNSAEVLRRRGAVIAQARAAPITERNAYLVELVRGRRVLDIGVVDHNLESGQQLHRQLAAVASHCLGIDVLEAPLKALAAEGLNVRRCDISREVVEGSFEVVVCGEVIEHLDRPAALFETAARTLVAGGVLVVTTPNPFYLARVRDGLRGTSGDNVDHVALFSPSCIAELAERSGLELRRFRGVRVDAARTLAGRAALALAGAGRLLGMAPEAFCNTLVFECCRPA